jgi:hypothetical protein
VTLEVKRTEPGLLQYRLCVEADLSCYAKYAIAEDILMAIVALVILVPEVLAEAPELIPEIVEELPQIIEELPLPEIAPPALPPPTYVPPLAPPITPPVMVPAPPM